MKTLNSDLKNKTYKSMYLLYGEEEFLKTSYKNRLKNAITGEDTINYAYFEGKGIDEDAFISAADTMPFFADMRCILVENSGWFKSAPDKICDYLSGLPETTHVIFVEAEVDKRNRLYKLITKDGYVCELKHPTPADLSRWAAEILKRSGKKITASNMDLFLSYTGDDMERTKQELEKLISYLGDKEIVDRADIDTITTVTATGRVYDMVRAITTRKTKEAMTLYEDLLTLKEPPMRILFLIARQFNQLLQVKDMVNAGSSKEDIAAQMKLSVYIAGKLVQQVRSFDRNAILNYVKQCVELDEAVKIGNMPERLAVEILITG